MIVFCLARSSLKEREREIERERENQNKRVLESVHAWKCLCAGDTSLFRTLIWTPSSGNLTGKVSFRTFYFLSLGKKIFYSSDMCYCSSHHSNVIFCLAIRVVGYTHSRENVSQRASDHWKCVGQSLVSVWNLICMAVDHQVREQFERAYFINIM